MPVASVAIGGEQRAAVEGRARRARGRDRPRDDRASNTLPSPTASRSHGRSGRLISVGSGAARDGPALLEHQHVRRQPHHVVEVVRDEDQRDVERPAQLVDLILQTPPHGAIDGGKRFVEQQHRRLARQRSRERDALTLAARQLVRPPVHAAPAGAPASSSASARARRSARGRCPSAVITLPTRGQVRKERVLLEHEPDGAAMRRHERPGRRVASRSRRPIARDACAGR